MIDVNNWLDIPGYGGIYKIHISSNQIKSMQFGKEKILKLNNGTHGHISFGIYINKESHKLYFHRVVAMMKYGYWCPNNLVTCHNDGNPQNNHPDNLRYDTQSENIKDLFRQGYKCPFQLNNPCKGKFGEIHRNAKKINQYTKSGIFIKEWGSIVEAKNALSISHISTCCRGITKTAGGFKWSYS